MKTLKRLFTLGCLSYFVLSLFVLSLVRSLSFFRQGCGWELPARLAHVRPRLLGMRNGSKQTHSKAWNRPEGTWLPYGTRRLVLH